MSRPTDTPKVAKLRKSLKPSPASEPLSAPKKSKPQKKKNTQTGEPETAREDAKEKNRKTDQARQLQQNSTKGKAGGSTRDANIVDKSELDGVAAEPKRRSSSITTQENRESADIELSSVKRRSMSNLTLTKVSGGLLSQFPAVFTLDSNFIFCCASSSIKVYSVATGELVRTLSVPNNAGENNAVTSLLLNPTNPLQLFSGSIDGCIRLWDFNDAVLLKTYETGFPITDMTMHKSQPHTMFIVTTSTSERKTTRVPEKTSVSVVHRYNMRESVPPQRRTTTLLKTSRCAGLAISENGHWLAVAGRKKLHVSRLNVSGFEFKTYYSEEPLSCLAFHPTEPCIAAGDERGRITLWYCLSANDMDDPITSVLHWHAHRVNHLTFTADGIYLLSGGEEAVLVIWQLSTGHKQFLPRLGSEIRSITVSPDQSMYAISHQDNSVRVLSATNLIIKQAILGLKTAQTNHSTYPLSTGLVVEPRNHHVVLNGLPGTIQFYNVNTDRHVMELEVAPRNRVSRTDDREVPQPHVLHVAFSADGNWMASVDTIEGSMVNFEPEANLKFWALDPETQTYTLNTRVDRPHDLSITSLAFHPGGRDAKPMVVTTSLDKRFKLWQLDNSADNRGEVSWICLFVGYYRNTTPQHAAFSPDGSILAIAYGQIITIWDPYAHTMHGVLVSPPETRPVHELAFPVGAHHLVAYTKDHLYVWDLLSCSITWSCQISVNQLAIDLKSRRFVCTYSIKKETRLVIFDPQNPMPLAIQDVQDQVKAISFLPSTSGNEESSLVFINKKWDIHIVAPLSPSSDSTTSTSQSSSKTALPRMKAQPKAYLTDIFGAEGVKSKYEIAANSKDNSSSLAPSSKIPLSTRRDILDTPSHIIPPVTALFEDFMQGFLAKASLENVGENNGTVVDV